MRVQLLALLPVALPAVALFTTGCGGLYEDVPVYGEDGPNAAVDARIAQIRAQAAPGSVEAISASQPVEVGQNVDVNAAEPPDTYSDTDPSALTDFQSALAPYGAWSDDSTYGTVWQPDPNVVGADFQPYVTAGHWDYYNDDYVWASDYDWGWAPFHYGRWAWIAGRGWCWIPGRRYAGAWVSWRVGAPGYGYIGWGPLAPTWGWRNGSVFALNAPRVPYAFCDTHSFFDHDLHGHMVRGNELTVVGGSTRPWNEGRTPANPTVGGAPPPSRLGVVPPPSSIHAATPGTPGLARALAYSRPSTAVQFGAHAPVASATMHATQVPFRGNIDHPIATAPHYNGVAPTPYHVYPNAHYPSQTIGAQRYNVAPRYSVPSYGSYGSYGRYGGGGFSGGGYHAPVSSPTYSHSYSHGGGFHGGGHGGHR